MQSYRLTTPEAVSFSYDIAGIGTRFLALLIDTVIQGAILTAVIIASIAFAVTGRIGLDLGLILLVTSIFLLFLGYFIFFETLWSGQTPGKRLLSIRVIKVSGYPITFLDALIRNLVRLVDLLPSAYGVGVICMFVSTESRRLGDYAAGTLVIKENAPASIRELDPGSAQSRFVLESPKPRGDSDPDELEWDLRAITSSDLEVIGAYLAREPALPIPDSRRIGDTIAERIAAKIGARAPYDPVRFLERVANLYEDERTHHRSER